MQDMTTDPQGLREQGVERADRLELHDNLGIGLAEVVRGLRLATVRAALLCLVVHAAQLSQQPLLAVQRCCHLKKRKEK